MTVILALCLWFGRPQDAAGAGWTSFPSSSHAAAETRDEGRRSRTQRSGKGIKAWLTAGANGSGDGAICRKVGDQDGIGA